MSRAILLIGSGAREHALARAIKRSAHSSQLWCFSNSVNPGIKKLSAHYQTGTITDVSEIVTFIANQKIDFAIIGPEAPLEKGIADALWSHNIPVIGPRKLLSQIETSKGFTRDLLKKHHIDASPAYQIFHGMEGVKELLCAWHQGYVIKADGLMGGKGVKVFGDHLQNDEESLEFCQNLVAKNLPFVIEEKLIGQEFSLISFSDGEHLAHSPIVQDHKRAFINDTGPNTGGMGTYTDANHSLPFLTESDVEAAKIINFQTMTALKKEYGEKYIGFLYGGFIATKNGVKLIEYNARLGDPEAMNILALLESDFVDVCDAMIEGNLTPDALHFAHKATVCKYAVPEGYPDHPVSGSVIDISNVQHPEQLYLSAVNEVNGQLIETGSRTVAVIGIADTLAEAEKIAEREINLIQGPLFHRADIGTKALIEKRILHMQTLRHDWQSQA